MKDNGNFTARATCSRSTTRAYAQYFVKYHPGLPGPGRARRLRLRPERAGLLLRANYPSMQWNGSGLDFFTGNDLLPAFHAAGLSTKVLALDWNWSNYASYGAPTVERRDGPQRLAVRRHRLARLRRGQRRRADHRPQPVPEHRRVRHRALRRHLDRQPAERGHEQHHRLHPQLGSVGRQVEPGRRPEHGPAQRRLRHLHRPDHRAQRRQPQRPGRLHDRVLRHGPADQVRQARRVPDRLDGEQPPCRTSPG